MTDETLDAARAAEQGRTRPWLGPALMILAIALLVGLDAIMKSLARTNSALVLGFHRNLFQLLILGVVLAWLGPARMLKTANLSLQVGRGVAFAFGHVCMILALSAMPIAKVHSVAFLAPLLVTLAAVPLLGERISARRLGLILLGFVGVLVALRPDVAGSGAELLYPIGFAVGSAVYQLLTRYCTRTDAPLAQLMYLSIFSTLTLSIPMPWAWVAMSLPDLLTVAAGGAIGTLAHLLVVLAYARAPASAVAPMSYTQIVWAALIGFVAFEEVPALSTLVGATIVVVCSLLLMRERA